jgi:hypothetical protein
LVAEQELGCDPGMVPAGEVTIAFRLCRSCAEKGTRVEVGELPQLPVYFRVGDKA